MGSTARRAPFCELHITQHADDVQVGLFFADRLADRALRRETEIAGSRLIDQNVVTVVAGLGWLITTSSARLSDSIRPAASFMS